MSSAQSSIAPDSSSYATNDAVTAPSIGKAATGSPLVRAIFESYGKEILVSASEQFLISPSRCDSKQSAQEN
jgi:hypothetical protein